MEKTFKAVSQALHELVHNDVHFESFVDWKAGKMLITGYSRHTVEAMDAEAVVKELFDSAKAHLQKIAQGDPSILKDDTRTKEEMTYGAFLHIRENAAIMLDQRCYQPMDAKKQGDVPAADLANRLIAAAAQLPAVSPLALRTGLRK